MSPPTLPPAVRIGGLDKPAILRRLQDLGVGLNPAAEALFADPRFLPQAKEEVVEVRAVTVAELGCPEGATLDELRRQAARAGLREPPLELAAHLRLQYTGQPEGAVGQPPTKHRAPPGSLTVLSAPLDDTDETPKGFYLRRIEGVLWLRGYTSGPEHVWSPDDVLVLAAASGAAEPGP